MKQGKLIRRAVSAALAGCMMFTLSAPALAESTDALMQLSIGSYRSSSLLSEENGLPAITVNGVTVNDANKGDILAGLASGVNAGKLSYNEATKTLESSGSIKGDLTIDAKGVNIELHGNSGEAAVGGKLTVINAQDVKVTAQSYVAVLGDVEISCDGKVEITSEESPTVAGDVTVKQASEVAISGEWNFHIVKGDVTIECPVPVTIQNKGTGGMASRINYSGGKYVYSDTENGTPVDPSSTPIDVNKNAVYITPVAARTITLTNATVDVPDNKAYAGQTVTVKADARAGYQFVRWEGNVALSSMNSQEATFTMPDEEVVLKARYKKLFTITVNQGTYTVNGTAAAEAVKGDQIVATAQDAPAGKKFASWTATGIKLTKDQMESPVVEFEMPKNAVELTAQYKTLHPVTVTNGKADKPTAAAGDTVTITPNDRLSEKLKFDHWEIKSRNVTLSGPKTATFTMPDAPVELEAVYNNLYTVTVNDGTATTKNAVAGTEVTVTANVPDGEKFTGWKVENNTALSLKGQSIDLTKPVITFTMPSTDITLTAEHKTIHTLWVVGGFIDGSGKSIQAIAGDTITVHSALAADQQFLHWTSEGMGLTDSQSKSDPLTITMPDSDVKITAVPKQLYTVTVVNGTVHDKSADTANPGDTVTIKAYDRTALGEVFVGWTVTSTDPNGQPNVKLDDPTAESTTFTMIGANVKVEATYEKQYTVTVLYQTEETGTPTIRQKQTAIYGDNIAVTAEDKTADDLIFDHWKVTVGGLDVPGLFADYEKADASFTMRRADVTLTAVYKKLYTITITNNVNNDVDSTRKTKVNGTVSLEAASIPGYRFKSWNVISGDATVTDAGILTLNGAGDVQVKAEYVQLYDLTVNHGTAVNANGAADSAAKGDSITATANDPTPDQIFTGWKVEGGDIGLTEEQLKDKSINFTMPAGAVTLTATYSYVHDQTVKVTYGKAHTDDTLADAEIIATPGETVYIEPDDRMADNLVFIGWEVTGGTGVTLDYDPDSFTMPQSDVPVEITAQYAELHAVTVHDGTATHENDDVLLSMNDGRHGALEGDSITIKANDRSAERKVFDHWKVTGDNVHLTPVNDDGSVATFEMPNEAVEITAVYKNVHTVTVHSEGSAENFENIKEGTIYKVTAPVISGKRFLRWVVNLGDVTDLDEKAGTFTMPDGDVDLTAEYVDLYNLTVTYGTAADANGDLATSAAEGDSITVTANKPYPTQTFEGWTLISGTIHDNDGNSLPMDEEGYILNADGTRLTDRSFTFVMCNDAVELKANYSMPIYVIAQPVTVEGGVAFAEGEAAAAEIFADPGKRITVSADPNADSNMIFDYWEVTSLDEDGKATATLEDATSMTTSFTMPMAPVELTAHWRTIDEAPSSGGAGGAGAAIAGVAIGGAAVWGGYEIATRIILNDLLPAGAAIPANRGQLALLIWTEKGKPEPAAQPAFADVADADMAKAAQWCTEQGIMDAKGDCFEPEGWTPKFKVIEVWNKAFPKQ